MKQKGITLFHNESARGGTVPQWSGPGSGVRTFEDFYATFDVDSVCSYIPADVAVLLPASSWAREGLRKPSLPGRILKRGADSGGFVASRIWGDYRYSLAQYVAWLLTWKPQWAATMDYCCEPELDVVTRERQTRTTQNAWNAWNSYKHLPFAWVPTIQGWLPEDYRRHAYEMQPLIEQMQAHYAQNPAWRVGIGTLCRRDDVVMVQAIVNAVRDVLPTIPFHLWGIKLDALRSINLAQVVSTDSAAWHGKFKHEIEETRRLAQQAKMSIRRYSVTVKLPLYTHKVHAAVAESAQVMNAQDNTRVLDRVRHLLRVHGGWTLDLPTRRNRNYAYAIRRNGTRRERRYLGPVSELAACFESIPARLLAQQQPGSDHCGTVPPLADSLWNEGEIE